ncbi:MAG: thioredoxin fold domain-containing protein [Telluria sp.]
MNARAAAARGHRLPLLTDLGADLALVAKSGAPLVLLVSRSDCAYCKQVRTNYLAPLAGGTRIVARELVSDYPHQKVAGAAAPDHAALAKKLGVRFYPTVLFFDAHMNQIAEPLLGADQTGFYSAYLDRRIDSAREKLAAK